MDKDFFRKFHDAFDEFMNSYKEEAHTKNLTFKEFDFYYGIEKVVHGLILLDEVSNSMEEDNKC